MVHRMVGLTYLDVYNLLSVTRCTLKTTTLATPSVMASYGLLSAVVISAVHLSVASYRRKRHVRLNDKADLPTFAESARAEPAEEFEQSGEPVRPEEFWTSIRRWKLFVLASSSATLALACYRIGWDVAICNARHQHVCSRVNAWLPDVADVVFWVC